MLSLSLCPSRSRRAVIAVFLIGFLTTAAWSAPNPARGKPAAKRQKIRRLTEDQRALHALNRLTFGAKPGDVQRVLAIGIDKWIEQQLHPDAIDDRALAGRLAPLRTLAMSTHDMVESFTTPRLIR